jgi:hypothetical protein
MTDPIPPEWRADFRAAEEQSLEASLAATPSQRLAWLEQALAFAYRVGALPLDESYTRIDGALETRRPAPEGKRGRNGRDDAG